MNKYEATVVRTLITYYIQILQEIVALVTDEQTKDVLKIINKYEKEIDKLFKEV